MIFDDPTALNRLKKYLSDNLGPICDADPDVLADYVVALLKHDKSNQDLKQLCITQLDDFLKKETEPFVQNLFDYLSSKEYLSTKSKGPDQPENVASASSSQTDAKQEKDNSAEKIDKPSSKPGRKREDSEASDDDDRNYKHKERGNHNKDEYKRYGDRSINYSGREDERDGKNKRFRGEGIPTGPAAGTQYNNNYSDDRFKRRRDDSEEEFRSNKVPRNNSHQNVTGTGNGYVSGNVNGPGRWGSDWNSNGLNMPAGDRFDDRRMRGGRINERGGGRGNPMGVRGGYSDIRPGRRQRCRDYDEKGYCMRGDLCPFDHGVDRIVVDEVPMNRPPFDIIQPINANPLAGAMGMMGGGVPGRPPFFMGAGAGRNSFDVDPAFAGQPSRPLNPSADAYDPERATLSRPEELIPSPIHENKDNELQGLTEGNHSESTISLTPTPNTSQFMDSGNASTRGASYRGRSRGRGGRGGFTRPSSGQGVKNSSLVVENIPPEFCAIDKVNEFFKKFGTITNINVDLAYQKAIVQFSTSQEAARAYNSPEPIFDNRFVKVYWHKGDKDEQQTLTATSVKPSSALAKPDTSLINQAETPAQQPLDLEAQKRKEDSLKALYKAQADLMERHIQAEKTLIELSEKKKIDPKMREELEKTLSKVSLEIKVDTSINAARNPTTGNVFLTKTLMDEKDREQLDRELDALRKLKVTGDSLEAETQQQQQTTSEAPKTEGEPLAAVAAVAAAAASSTTSDASTYRGRGRGTFYRARGARGGWPRARGGGVMRSYKLDNRTTKLLVKEVPVGTKEALRAYFEQFGEVETMSFADVTKTAIVQYKSRKDAEQAMLKGTNIPDIGTLQMAWHNATAQNTALTDTSPTVHEGEPLQGGQSSTLPVDSSEISHEGQATTSTDPTLLAAPVASADGGED